MKVNFCVVVPSSTKNTCWPVCLIKFIRKHCKNVLTVLFCCSCALYKIKKCHSEPIRADISSIGWTWYTHQRWLCWCNALYFIFHVKFPNRTILSFTQLCFFSWKGCLRWSSSRCSNRWNYCAWKLCTRFEITKWWYNIAASPTTSFIYWLCSTDLFAIFAKCEKSSSWSKCFVYKRFWKDRDGYVCS